MSSPSQQHDSRPVCLQPLPDEVAVLLPAAALHPLHRLLLDVELRGARDGAGLPPALRRAKESLRSAAMSVDGRVSRTSADIVPASVHATGPPLITTEALATALGGVTPRQARRIAKAAGVMPLAPNRWHADDARSLSTQRRTA